MYIIEAMRIAWTTLATNKLRSGLTVLGIVIGVGAVIGMLAMGRGFQQFLAGQFAQFGVGTFYLVPVVDSKRASAIADARLTAADGAALAAPGAIDGVTAVVIEWNDTATMNANGERLTYPIRATTPNVFAVQDYELLAGRFYTAQEHDRRARVAVVGRSVAERIAERPAAAVGQRVMINGVGFDIIGVLATESQTFGFSGDPAESVFVPYQTAITRLFRNQTSSAIDVSSITIQMRDPEQITPAIAEVTTLLRERHRTSGEENSFTVVNPDQFAQQANAVIGGFNAFLGLVAGIALFVGGIGIMNIMLVSVTERTAEIGLRKALGARRVAILSQFLIEAVLLALLGSVIGVLLGFGIAALGTFVLVYVFTAEGAQASVTPGAVMLATGIAAAVGIIFGFFPALRAARLNPIEALRYE